MWNKEEEWQTSPQHILSFWKDNQLASSSSTPFPILLSLCVLVNHSLPIRFCQVCCQLTPLSDFKNVPFLLFLGVRSRLQLRDSPPPPPVFIMSQSGIELRVLFSMLVRKSCSRSMQLFNWRSTLGGASSVTTGPSMFSQGSLFPQHTHPTEC